MAYYCVSVHLVKWIQRTLTVARPDPAVLDFLRPEVQHRCFRAEVVCYGVSALYAGLMKGIQTLTAVRPPESTTLYSLRLEAQQGCLRAVEVAYNGVSVHSGFGGWKWDTGT